MENIIFPFASFSYGLLTIRALGTTNDILFVARCLEAEGGSRAWTSGSAIDALTQFYGAAAPGFYAVMVEQAGGKPILAMDMYYGGYDSRLNLGCISPGDWTLTIYLSAAPSKLLVEQALALLLSRIFHYRQFRRLLFVSKRRDPGYLFLLQSTGAVPLPAKCSDEYDVSSLTRRRYGALAARSAGIYQWLA